MVAPRKPMVFEPAKGSGGQGQTSFTLTPNPDTVHEGQQIVFTLFPSPDTTEGLDEDPNYGPKPLGYVWKISFGTNLIKQDAITQDPDNPANFTWDTSGTTPGVYTADLTVKSSPQKPENKSVSRSVSTSATVNLRPISRGDILPVTMKRAAEPPSSDMALWIAIRHSANRLRFQKYLEAIDTIMCCPGNLEKPALKSRDICVLPPLSKRRFLPFPDMDAYRLLKVATECFLMMNCGVYIAPEELQRLFKDSGYDLNDDASRLNQNAANLPSDIIQWWSVYLRSADEFLNKSQADQDPDSELRGHTIPYLALVRSRLHELHPVESYKMGMDCHGILKKKLTNPCLIELIWSYWHEEGMLVQTLNAISRRFQNFCGTGDRDPLIRFDIDPLRGLNNLLWGYIQDEQHRLTVVRRAYEYNHEYGLTLEGKALRALRPTDSRSKFLEAYHNLLYLCTIFFKEDDDTTVMADGFPVLNALKEVHYILAAGAHNQFGDLPSTARQEMLMQQWLLARPEMREFLGGKIMVPYPEDWMDRVDNVKSMAGWTDVSVVHFHDLAVYGEQVVLSIRYGAWSLTSATAAQAANWARYWRNEIQGYIHAYRAATGIDLTTEPVNSTLPSVLLRKRLAAQRSVAIR